MFKFASLPVLLALSGLVSTQLAAASPISAPANNGKRENVGGTIQGCFCTSGGGSSRRSLDARAGEPKPPAEPEGTCALGFVLDSYGSVYIHEVATYNGYTPQTCDIETFTSHTSADGRFKMNYDLDGTATATIDGTTIDLPVHAEGSDANCNDIIGSQYDGFDCEGTTFSWNFQNY